jgi:hypothetical protein
MKKIFTQFFPFQDIKFPRLLMDKGGYSPAGVVAVGAVSSLPAVVVGVVSSLPAAVAPGLLTLPAADPRSGILSSSRECAPPGLRKKDQVKGIFFTILQHSQKETAKF